MIDAFASAPHYADHVSAVFGALGEAVRGSFLTNDHHVADRARARGFRVSAPRGGPGAPVLVSSYGDLRRAVGLGRTRIALMEHGAGQSYHGRPGMPIDRRGSYAGGENRGAASLFLHPGPHPAAMDRAAYPGARVEVVGSPFLDLVPRRVGEPAGVVAFSFHFNTPIAPETRNAYSWALPAITALRGRFPMLGHAHPRLFASVRRGYQHLGIEPVADFMEVCRRADVYVCDNSSTLFAFAATGRPVVVLNPPWYDRGVDHGLRFWSAAGVGVSCEHPADLGDCIDEALRNTDAQRKAREAALDVVYAYRSGASRRAADVLQEWAA